jgi:transcriptional regulator with XRE-family HTH domain
MNGFSERFKARRGELGLTQEQTAQTCGVSLRTVARWELGQSEPNSAIVWRRVNAFLGDAVTPTPVSKDALAKRYSVLRLLLDAAQTLEVEPGELSLALNVLLDRAEDQQLSYEDLRAALY